MSSSSVNRDASVAAALGRSEPLAALMQRMRESKARFEAVRSLLPDTLQPIVRAGPLDDTGWVLLAPHAAAAAKLRQLLPSLQESLRAAGFVERALKVKVVPPQ